jgi:ferrous iron transport protein B
MDGSFGNQDSADSVLSRVSRGLTPVFRPMGITDDNWPASVGLFTGIFAKELIVGTLDSLYSQEARSTSDEEHNPVFDFKGGIADAFRAIPAGFSSMQLGLFSLPEDPAEAEDDVSSDARRIMRERFDGRVGAAAYLLFVLIYAPCLAVVATIIRETSWRWGLLSLSYLTGLAWILSTLFYQSARFLRHPASSLGWITLCLALLLGVYGLLKRLSRRIQVPAEDP